MVELGELQLSEANIKLMTLVLRHCAKLEINFDAVTAEGGYKNKKVANTLWGQLKKKILTADGGGAEGDGDGNAGGQTLKTPKTPKTSTPKRKNATSAAGSVKKQKTELMAFDWVGSEDELVKQEVGENQ